MADETIFKYRDRDGDELDVWQDEDSNGVSQILFHATGGGSQHLVSVALPRDQVLRLTQVLSEWAYPVHTPEGPNRSLIEELIAKAVKEQVTAVLPLHLKTVGRVCTRDESCGVADPEPLRCDYDCSGCNPDDDPDDDPEPHDVGHVDRPHPCDEPLKPGQLLQDVHEACGFLWALHKVMAPADKPEPEPEHGRLMAELPRRPCDAPLQSGQPLAQVHEECGFLWVLHKVAGADGPQSRCEGCRSGNHPHVFRPCKKPGCGCRETVPEPEHGRLMAELPRRPRTAPKCLDCLHGWGEHTGGICWGTGGQDNEGDGCRCTRERPSALSGALPSAPAPKTECTCVHPRVALHNCLGCVERSCTCRWTGAS